MATRLPDSPASVRSDERRDRREPVRDHVRLDDRPHAAQGPSSAPPAATAGRPTVAPQDAGQLAFAAIAAQAPADPGGASRQLEALGTATRSSVVHGLQAKAGNGTVQRLVSAHSDARSRAASVEAASPMGEAGGSPSAEGGADLGVPGAAAMTAVILPDVGGAGASGAPGSPGAGDGSGGAASGGAASVGAASGGGGTARVQRAAATPVVQRHDDPPAHPHPHPGTWTTLQISSDIIGLLDELPALLGQIHSMRPAPVRGRVEAAPEGIAQPQLAALVCEDKIIFTDSQGAPNEVRELESEIPVASNTAFLLEFNRGVVWQLGTRDNRIEAIPSDLTAGRLEQREVGQAGLFVYLPGAVAGVPEIMNEVQRRIRTSDQARRRAAGPPGWARTQGRRLQERLDQRGRGGSGGTGGDGPGLGARGPGTGGGGTGDTGEPGTGGTGGGTGTGDRTTSTPPADPASPPRATGADSIQVTVDWNGDPVCRVTADGASTTIPMRQGETDDQLVSRADAAADALRLDRSGASSIRIANGATTTGFRPGTVGQEVPADQAREQAQTGGGETPGERPQGTGDANTPSWPSQIRVYGMQPPEAPITVRGATNDFTMEIDRGSDAFNYFQTINYYWELIRVDGMSREDRARASAMTGVGAGQHVSRASGEGQDVGRDLSGIAEDFHNEDWLTIASEYQMIALSAAVRSLGSVVSAFFAAVTRPLNEQAIGFDTEGDFILRCVATPIVDREWLERHGIPRERQTIRASSVSTVPIRVRGIQARALEVNRGEEDEIANKRHELEAARQAGRPQEEIDQLQRELEALVRRHAMDPTAHLTAEVTDLEQMLTVLSHLEAADRDNLPLERRDTDVLELDVGLRFANLGREAFRTQTQGQLDAKRGQRSRAQTWGADFSRSFRPLVTFASEVNGQTIQMVAVLGEHSDSRQNNGPAHWVLADVTSPGTQQRYHGRSTQAGLEGNAEAIRRAFVDFRENGEYGRGTIAITLPGSLGTALGGPVSIDSTMRAAPGHEERSMRRLQDLATVAAIAGLVVTGPAGLAVGAAGGLAGAVVAAHRMARRSEGDRLHLDYETFTDIVDIIGGLVSIVSVGTAAIGAMARRGTALARAGASAADLSQAASSFRWVQRMEMTDRAIHIFGLIQGIGQGVIMIPYSLYRQLEAIDADQDTAPGRKRARRALAMAQAMQSGVITVISVRQMLSHGAPEVTPDSVVWDRLAAATAPAEGGSSTQGGGTSGTPGPTGGGTSDVSGAGGVTGTGDATGAGRGRSGTGDGAGTSGRQGDQAPDRGGTSGTTSEGGGGAADSVPRVVRVDPPTVPAEIGGGQTTGGPGGEAGTQRGPTTGGIGPGGTGGGHGPSGGLSAAEVFAAASRIITGNPTEPPPAGRIRYVPEAEFLPLAAGDTHLVGTRSADGVLTISLDRAQAAGLVPRLRALVASRRSQLAGRHLGDSLAGALMNRMTGDVLAGDPGIGPSLGDGVLDRMQATVGDRALLDALVHGNLGAVRDPLRTRFGAARADAILAAARSGATDTLAGLLHEPSAAFGDRYGVAAAAVGDLVTADLGGTPRDPGRLDLARALADAVGGRVLRDAYASGDPARVDAALDAALGNHGAQEVRRALQEGRTADALRALRGAGHEGLATSGPADVVSGRGTGEGTGSGDGGGTRGGGTGAEPSTGGTGAEPASGQTGAEPATGGAGGGDQGRGAPADTVPPQAERATNDFLGALAGEPATLAQKARALLEQMRDFRLLRRLVDGGSVGTVEQRQAVKDGLQQTRSALTTDVLNTVKAAIEQRFPGVEIHLQDLGTPGFGSDRDVTLRAEARAGADPAPSVNDLVAASTEAVRDAYQALRDAGLDPDHSLDTNFYTELHEGRVQPASAGERMAISADQSIVSLTEMRVGMTDAQWTAHREAQMRSIESSGAPDAIRRDMRASMERQFAAAEERAARLGHGEQALQAARERLLQALRRPTPPATAFELRSLMADVKLLEPDAYGTRAAVEGVVYGQQGMTRATTQGQQAGAWEHLGPVGRGEIPLPEQLGDRAQQAEASLGHFWSHFPESGLPTAGDARSLAKQLGRVAHAFREAGLSISSRLVDTAGDVVGAKHAVDSDGETMTQIRGWAEDSGIRGDDPALLRAWGSEARRVATEMSTRLRTSQELARAAHPEGDRGYQGPTGTVGGPTGAGGTGGGPTGTGGTGGGTGGPSGPSGPTTGGGGGPGGPGGPAGPAGASGGRPPLPVELQQRVAAVRDRIATMATQSGQARRAAEWRRALDAVLARPDLAVADVQTIVSSIEDGMTGPAPVRDAPLVTLDAHDPSVVTSLHEALVDPSLGGDPLWTRYVEAVLAAYERAGVLEVGPSPRGTDADRISQTGGMRIAFLRALDHGGVGGAARGMYQDHVRWARASAGSDAAAVARGDLVWIDPVSGDTLAAHQSGALVWPADPVWGPWRVDHAVELQHGGADDPSNYIAITQRMHAPKTQALAAWTRRMAEQRAAASHAGEDLVGSAPR